ncbi:cupin domain-containing protein [Sphingopyxis indica]|uniref:cupin domain-containing protein n=1 Tax=Sphingopyxis indica TaxID=436663 RepID=UPI002938D896|nr:cupin domain-containing protein [Sphingopyxis indica]WOF42990.1 cupin domain-containing protein [Sphingopyxis indica]
MGQSSPLSEGDANNRRRLRDELAALNCAIHQPDDPPLFTREPASPMRPVHWKWGDLAALLETLGHELDLERGGNRRTLRLTNPGLPYGTTPTFWGSIQLILPGEVATAHRHAASALRFIIKGSGAFTTVERERYPMNEGDLVLTPNFMWHDHEHRGEAPMIWLDVLDISLVRSLHATFFAPFESDLQPVSKQPQRSFQLFGSGIMRPPSASTNGSNPLLVYPVNRAMAALQAAGELDGDPDLGTVLEYQNPLTGGPALTTLTPALQALAPGHATRYRRMTASSLTYVVAGKGTSEVGESLFDWGPGDFFVIPPWAWHRHQNLGGHRAVFFTVSDAAAHQALGLYREERHRGSGRPGGR